MAKSVKVYKGAKQYQPTYRVCLENNNVVIRSSKGQITLTKDEASEVLIQLSVVLAGDMQTAYAGVTLKS